MKKKMSTSMSSAEKVYLDHFSGSLGRFCPGVPDVPREGTSVTKKPVFMPDVPVFGTSVTVTYKVLQVGTEKGRNWRRQGF